MNPSLQTKRDEFHVAVYLCSSVAAAELGRLPGHRGQVFDSSRPRHFNFRRLLVRQRRCLVAPPTQASLFHQ